MLASINRKLSHWTTTYFSLVWRALVVNHVLASTTWYTKCSLHVIGGSLVQIEATALSKAVDVLVRRVVEFGPPELLRIGATRRENELRGGSADGLIAVEVA